RLCIRGVRMTGDSPYIFARARRAFTQTGGTVVEKHLDIPGPDGTIDAILVRPDGTTAFPGVILLTDIFGNRPGNTDVASQIAKHGYVVLTPNIFFRTARPPVFDLQADFSDEGTTTK